MKPKREQASPASRSASNDAWSNHAPTGLPTNSSSEYNIVDVLDTLTPEDKDEQDFSVLDSGLTSAQMDGSPSALDLDIPKLNDTPDPLVLSRLNTKLEMLLQGQSGQSITIFQHLADLCRNGVFITT